MSAEDRRPDAADTGVDRPARQRRSARPDLPVPDTSGTQQALQAILHALRTGQLELELVNLQLTALPPEIGQLTNLQRLDPSINKLTTLPPELSQLTSLQTLHLEHNQLTTLPPELGQLTNLRTLWLRTCASRRYGRRRGGGPSGSGSIQQYHTGP